MRFFLCLLAMTVLASGEAKTGIPYEKIDWSGAPPGPTGFTPSTELKDPKTGSTVMKYQVYAPEQLPKERTLGLVIGFHGLGYDERASASGYWPMKHIGLDGEYVFAGGKSMGNGWAMADETRLLQFVDWLMTVYPIDRRRVFYWGHSNGGWAVGTFGPRHQDRIAGIVRYSGYGGELPTSKNPAETLLEWYLVHGTADPTVKVGSSRSLRQLLLGAGHRFVYRELIGADHGNELLWDKRVSDDAARWIHTLRHKQLAPPADDLAFLAGLAKARDTAFDAEGAKPDTWQRLVRIGGPQAWSVAAKAAKSKQPAVRTALAEACAKVGFSPEASIAACAGMLDDADPGVRIAAIAALRTQAGWRGLAAQMALAKFALRKKSDPGERVAATDALAAVLPLPFLGNCADDTPAFEGISALLDSDLATVREAAAAPLKLAAADGFGYDPAATGQLRSAAIARWRAWFSERAGAIEAKR